MPVRNARRTLGAAVYSTLHALPQDAELVIHDDASDDGTTDVLGDLTDKRVRLLRSDQPRGVAAGLNYLLASIDAELVARMDADDVCLPMRFARQVAAVDRGVDTTFTTVIYFRSALPRLRIMPWISISPDAFPLHLLLANPVAHSTMLGRVDHVRAVGGYREVPSEDYDLWLRMSANGSAMSRLGRPGLLYRLHSAQVTSSTSWLAGAATDHGIVEAYEALAAQYFDVESDWYPHLRAARRGRRLPHSAESLTKLAGALARASEGLSDRERRFLLSKCHVIVT